MGFVDFAGSTVVHSVGGWVGLVALTLIGSRTGKYSEDGGVKKYNGHNLLYCYVWNSFSGLVGLVLMEAALSSFSGHPNIVANTMLAATGNEFCFNLWMDSVKICRGYFPLNGVLAGLVSVTAACHSVTPFNQ